MKQNLRINSMFWFNEILTLTGLLFWGMATFFPKSLDIFLVFSPNEVDSVAESEFFRLGWGIAGAMLVGWSITLHAVNQQGIDGLFSSRNLIYLALGSWFVLDSITSIVTGFVYNVIGNVLFSTLAIYSFSSYSKPGRTLKNTVVS